MGRHMTHAFCDVKTLEVSAWEQNNKLSLPDKQPSSSIQACVMACPWGLTGSFLSCSH